MNNPYSILGVSEHASDEEIKRAYRELSRKYHPDSYVDNPLQDLAEDKFKEVQAAYQEIMQQRQQSGYSGTSQSSTGGSWRAQSSTSGSWSSQTNGSGYGQGTAEAEYQEVYNYINFRQYRNALSALFRIQKRDGRWYYLSAITNAGMGNNYQANKDIDMACSMEPGNVEYQNLRNSLQSASQRYQTNYRNYNAPTKRDSDCGTGNFCCDLWIADTCCECMGGDLCSCM